MADASALTEMQRLLLMTAAFHDLRPGAPLTANCGRLIGTALRWAGLLSPDVRAAFTNDFEYHPVIREWYAALIGMVQHRPAKAALLEGAGNFGTPAEPLALPWFTACRLTRRGERVADELLAQYPGYRRDAEPQ
jgi:hypothetical protein